MRLLTTLRSIPPSSPPASHKPQANRPRHGCGGLSDLHLAKVAAHGPLGPGVCPPKQAHILGIIATDESATACHQAAPMHCPKSEMAPLCSSAVRNSPGPGRGRSLTTCAGPTAGAAVAAGRVRRPGRKQAATMKIVPSTYASSSPTQHR